MTDEMKQCPHCAETIKQAAKVCRFCSLAVDETIPNKTTSNEHPSERQHVRAHSGISDGVKLSAGNALFKVMVWVGIIILLILLVKCGG